MIFRTLLIVEKVFLCFHITRTKVTRLDTRNFSCVFFASVFCWQTFECDELEELQSAYLRADYSMYCYTAQHKSYMVYSGVMILVRAMANPIAVVQTSS